MADHDTGYKRLFSHPEMVVDLHDGAGAVAEPDRSADPAGHEDLESQPGETSGFAGRVERAEHSDLQRSFAVWIRDCFLPALPPGAEVPEVTNLQEVRSMLVERVAEWTQEWKQEGFRAGLEEGLARVRGVLLARLEKRFGLLPEETRRRIEAVSSFEDLGELIARVETAPSLEALGLS